MNTSQTLNNIQGASDHDLMVAANNLRAKLRYLERRGERRTAETADYSRIVPNWTRVSVYEGDDIRASLADIKEELTARGYAA